MVKWILGMVLIFSSVTGAELSVGLSGNVVDQNGEAVVGANITVEEMSLKKGKFGLVTDSNGDFYFKKIPVGIYVLRVTHVGYEDLIKTDVAISENRNYELSISMQEKAIFLDKTVVSASRRQEKIINAPASVSVVERKEIQDQPVLSVVEHIRDLPAIDFSQTGLSQASVVARGFNDAFSGSMLALTDNRISRVPSLRLNAYNFIPVTNDDIERIELVFGPGSALYGPNSANSVMHIITRSPLDYQGTNLNFGMGERNVRRLSIRHAGKFSDKFGYKISGQVYSGTDWKYVDPVESRARINALSSGEVDPRSVRIGARDYDQSRVASEVRIDYRPTDDFSAVISGGYNSASTIEMTTLGAGLSDGWVSGYYQARLAYKDLFIQAYKNWTDAGDSFFLREGGTLIDKSDLTVLQLQHAYKMTERQQFIYGTDALFTRPNTGGSINGANEDDDNINELGVFLQSETSLSDMLSLVFAGRYDKHNRMPDGEFSPRVALIFKPTSYHTLRFTHNIAFSPPNSNNLFVDIPIERDLFKTGALLGPTFGFDMRAQGTYHHNAEGGFRFARSANGRPQFRSPFAPFVDPSLDKKEYWELDDPLFTNVMWGVGRNATLAQIAPVFSEQLQAAGFDAATAQAQAGALAQSLQLLVPDQLAGLKNSLMKLNGPSFEPVEDVKDIPLTRSTNTHTLELGYKGVLGKKLVVAADAYRTTTKNFVGPLAVQTPNVFLEPVSLAGALGSGIAATMADPANARIAEAVAVLDAAEFGGNANSTAVDEITALFVSGAAGIHYGTVSPEQAYDPTAVMLAYRNFGKVTTSGLDLNMAYYPSDKLIFSGGLSFIGENFFKNVDNISDIALNAPKLKIKMGVSYAIPESHVRLSTQLRYNSGFKQSSGVYVGEVDPYSVADLSINYLLPTNFDLQFSLNISNVLNNKHIEFFGAPQIGRLSLFQVKAGF